ncbi:alpha/beta hydrolase [Enterococcus saccharolyticus]|uniref:Esterase n=1 Tax=Enterococcus saccharolyticus subsp. saccharolyticus ATCC 43076 TaxID=1139996 RepID=S0JDI0_9ENTE|nr:alpha/beta hydrolase family protein [Enterococcus saccharolyticus]EOT25753.1 esterase [Enterococcus saccharolyticus subsp. saccharolyticus ATCC 43076]EOT83137.1 esterase [Enterococcus saccharolyticus subsp. saccharolyticus ATCC 43076]OJG90480.1 esterase [Enterococcus saccharolyticus]
MAFLQANVYSNELGMEVMVNVILPQQTKKVVGKETKGALTDVPVLYLLHGMNGNHSVWARRTSIERYVSDLGLAVIMPSTDLGFYTDTTYDMNYWTFISEELPKICHELFPQLTTKREKTFAAGLSMGGYGAMKLGLRKPEKFAAVASLSGALALAESTDSFLEIRGKNYWEGIFGPLEKIKGSENDLIHLIQTIDKKQAPRFFITCGTEDELYDANVYATKQLKKRRLDVTFEDGPGAHDWDFWDKWIQRVLTWIAEK